MYVCSNIFARLPTTSCLNYLCKIPRLWANANGPLTSLAGYMRCSEGRREGGTLLCRQTENLHRYPMKDNRAYSPLWWDWDHFAAASARQTAQTDDIDKPYLRSRRWGCIKSYLSRFPICSSLTNYVVVRLEFAPEIEVVFVCGPIE